MIFTTSWDDGHPCDERLAAMLDHYGLAGTFYIPIKNQEGRQVMDALAMRELDRRFEIGSHTLDHAYLTKLTAEQCDFQILAGKHQLEDILGHNVGGFCYPGGKFNADVRESVINAQFVYARGISNFWLNSGIDSFNIPTTIQFYPHSRQVLWRNFIKHGHYSERFPAFKSVAVGMNWLSAMKNLVEAQSETERVIHIWGHSWEIEDNNLWSQLDDFLNFVSELNPVTCRLDELRSHNKWSNEK